MGGIQIVKPLHSQTQDKQLHGIALEGVLEKRRLDQALNAKVESGVVESGVCRGERGQVT